VCECSDAALLDELRGRLRRHGGAGDTVSFVELPADINDLPAGLMAASSVANVRRSPDHASELVTQIIYGDGVEPLKEDGEWYLVRMDDVYIGWIRSWHLVSVTSPTITAYADSAKYRTSVNHAMVLQAPSRDALPVTDLVFGTKLEIDRCARRGWRSVRLPDGKEGFITAREVEKNRARKRISRKHLSETGLRFLGIPYIWGGTTPKGFDCSGLVQRIYRIEGLVIPRDADMQAGYGREGTADPDNPVAAARELSTGDLIFFGKSASQITHVAMYLSENLFLHAFGQVRVGSLDPASQLFESRLVPEWRVSRDVISYNK
ncbi:MAG: C40 family peptidase, partial [Candidatus Krumholzibacteria bacterium]|nr:C40 family peptidase [Candidatus Krumholzibacteria bacterium]